jgi:hypothetical protein
MKTIALLASFLFPLLLAGCGGASPAYRAQVEAIRRAQAEDSAAIDDLVSRQKRLSETCEPGYWPVRP